MSLTASANSDGTVDPPAILLRYLDLALVVIAAPILLLIGVPALGYGVGAGAWILLRAVGIGVERYAAAVKQPNAEITVRLVYLLGRLFLLALTIVLVRRDEGRSDGLTALLVIVFAFTTELITSVATRPRSR